MLVYAIFSLPSLFLSSHASTVPAAAGLTYTKCGVIIATSARRYHLPDQSDARSTLFESCNMAAKVQHKQQILQVLLHLLSVRKELRQETDLIGRVLHAHVVSSSCQD